MRNILYILSVVVLVCMQSQRVSEMMLPCELPVNTDYYPSKQTGFDCAAFFFFLLWMIQLYLLVLGWGRIYQTKFLKDHKVFKGQLQGNG